EASVAESLGSPAEIAETAVREFRRRRNLLSRSRLAAFCTFVLLPLPALCLAWIASLAGLVLLGEILNLLGEILNWLGIPDRSAEHEVTGLQVFLTWLVLIGILVVPAAGVAAL